MLSRTRVSKTNLTLAALESKKREDRNPRINYLQEVLITKLSK